MRHMINTNEEDDEHLSFRINHSIILEAVVFLALIFLLQQDSNQPKTINGLVSGFSPQRNQMTIYSLLVNNNYRRIFHNHNLCAWWIIFLFQAKIRTNDIFTPFYLVGFILESREERARALD